MFCLSPLLKGLRIEQVITRLKEDQQLKLDEKGRESGRRRYTRTVAEDIYRRLLELASHPISSRMPPSLISKLFQSGDTDSRAHRSPSSRH